MKTKKRRPSGTALPVRNDILHALLNSEYQHLSPKLEPVTLKVGIGGRGFTQHQSRPRIA
jgi:hypothetical protein